MLSESDLVTAQSTGIRLSPNEALAANPLQSGAMVVETKLEKASKLRFGFVSGGFHLMVPDTMASEILTGVSVYPLPNLPAWITGVANIRGALVPVVDLATALDTELPEAESSKALLMFGKGEEAIALPMMQLPAALSLNGALDDRPPLPRLLEISLIAAFLVGSEVWLEVDFDNLFASLIPTRSGD